VYQEVICAERSDAFIVSPYYSGFMFIYDGSDDTEFEMWNALTLTGCSGIRSIEDKNQFVIMSTDPSRPLYKFVEKRVII
jgi:hypothetical protein